MPGATNLAHCFTSMFVSKKIKLIYLCPPKTGSISLSSAFCLPPFDAELKSSNKSHHGINWQPTFDQYKTFISVRHPFVRAVSLWRYGCNQALCKPWSYSAYSWWRLFTNGLPSLIDFLKFASLQETLKTVWRCSWHTEQLPKPVDYVIHLERLDEDLALIPELQGMVVPKLNTGPNSRFPWHHFYEVSPDCITLVQELWAKDFTQFGYVSSFEECKQGIFLED